MDLAKRIGANPNKLAGSRTNISFLGKGPKRNPLFQEPIAGLEGATPANLGKPESLWESIEDAVGWAKDGKLNSIQTEILGRNLTGIEKILHPPVLPSLPTASVTAIRPGIAGLKKFPRETHKFFGRPLKNKDFSEIDRMVMEGKLPDARSRTWTLKTQGPGTGIPKKTNIPASKINHQMIADQYGIDVELIKGKDWIEILEVIRNLGLKHGGLAEILQAPRRGRVVHPGGYSGISKRQKFINLARSGGSRQDFIDLASSYKHRSLDAPYVFDPLEALMLGMGMDAPLKKGGLARILEI